MLPSLDASLTSSLKTSALVDYFSAREKRNSPSSSYKIILVHTVDTKRFTLVQTVDTKRFTLVHTVKRQRLVVAHFRLAHHPNPRNSPNLPIQ